MLHQYHCGSPQLTTPGQLVTVPKSTLLYQRDFLYRPNVLPVSQSSASNHWRYHSYMYTYCYLFFNKSLCRVHVMFDCQVHKLVLQLSLYHTRPLRPNHLNGLLYINLALQTWTTTLHPTVFVAKIRHSNNVTITTKYASIQLLECWLSVGPPFSAANFANSAAQFVIIHGTIIPTYLHSQSLDWFWQIKQHRKINIQKLNTNTQYKKINIQKLNTNQTK